MTRSQSFFPSFFQPYLRAASVFTDSTPFSLKLFCRYLHPLSDVCFSRRALGLVDFFFSVSRFHRDANPGAFPLSKIFLSLNSFLLLPILPSRRRWLRPLQLDGSFAPCSTVPCFPRYLLNHFFPSPFVSFPDRGSSPPSPSLSPPFATQAQTEIHIHCSPFCQFITKRFNFRNTTYLSPDIFLFSSSSPLFSFPYTRTQRHNHIKQIRPSFPCSPISRLQSYRAR